MPAANRAPVAFILGVDGQDGSYLAEYLVTKGYEVIGWLPEGVRENSENLAVIQTEIKIVLGDLRDQNSLKSILENYHPDEIYNLASPSFAESSWSQPELVGEISALGVTRLLQSILEVCPKARFFQASSSEVFGDPAETPQNEDTPFHPRNPYGVAKAYAHWITASYRKRYGLFVVSGILYNHESPRRGLQFVTRKITAGAARISLGQETELRLGNLDSQRDWGYAGDTVRAMWLMLQAPEAHDLVIGTGETHTVKDVCELAFSELNLDFRKYVIQDPQFIRPLERGILVADNQRAGVLIGWRPETSFVDLIKLMVRQDLARLKCV